MRGIVHLGGGEVVVTDDLEVRAPGPTEVAVRLAAAGVCHSHLPLPDGTIPFPTPGVGAVHTRRRVKTGQSAVVYGVGGVGLNVVQALRLVGASRIVAVDANPAKEALARQFGATDFVLAGPETTDAVRGLFPAAGTH